MEEFDLVIVGAGKFQYKCKPGSKLTCDEDGMG